MNLCKEDSLIRRFQLHFGSKNITKILSKDNYASKFAKKLIKFFKLQKLLIN